VGTGSALSLLTPQPGWAELSRRHGGGRRPSPSHRQRASRLRHRGHRLSGRCSASYSAMSGQALRPAIIWATRERESNCDLQRASPSFDARSRIPIARGCGPDAAVLKEHERQLTGGAQWALQPKDWLRLRMIHEAGDEPSDRVRHAPVRHDHRLLGQGPARGARPPTRLLAAIRDRRDCGILTASARRHLGFVPTLPVVGGAMRPRGRSPRPSRSGRYS